MNAIIAVVLGIIIGFVGEWLFDFFYLRRKTRRLEENIADLAQQVTAAEGQLDAIAAENQRLKRAVLGIAEEEEPEAEEVPAEGAGGEAPTEPAEQDVWLPDFVAEVEQEISQEMAVDEGASTAGDVEQVMPEVPPADEPLITEPPEAYEESVPPDIIEEPPAEQPVGIPGETSGEGDMPPETPEESLDMGDEESASDLPSEPGI